MSGSTVQSAFPAGLLPYTAGRTLPVEVKAGALRQAKVSWGYRNFLKTYQPPAGWIINGSLNQETEVEKTRLIFVTPDQLPGKIRSLQTRT